MGTSKASGYTSRNVINSRKAKKGIMNEKHEETHRHSRCHMGEMKRCHGTIATVETVKPGVFFSK
jgi:hypothetical protein